TPANALQTQQCAAVHGHGRNGGGGAVGGQGHPRRAYGGGSAGGARAGHRAACRAESAGGPHRLYRDARYPVLALSDRPALANPGYPPYRHILSALGCEPVLIGTCAETRWAITGEALDAEHRRKPLAGLVVASPANPTGTMMEAGALARLISAAEALGIRVISDEIYHGLDYAFSAETAAKLSERVLVINSFSKYFCMTGWRVGWMVVPDNLVRAAERLQGNLAISVPTLAQVAAQAAFGGRAEMEAVKRGYEENRRILVAGLPKAGLDKFLPVDGAFYLYAD